MPITFLQSFNSDLVEAFQLGIVIGVLVLSALILFPGRTDNTNDPTQNTAVPPKDHVVVESPEITMKESSSWSPHRRLNFAVYIIVLSSACVIWFSSYAENDTTASVLLSILKVYFPREASTFSASSKK